MVHIFSFTVLFAYLNKLLGVERKVGDGDRETKGDDRHVMRAEIKLSAPKQPTVNTGRLP